MTSTHRPDHSPDREQHRPDDSTDTSPVIETRPADEGLLTRTNEYGGIEPRVRNRPEKPPLGAEIAEEMDRDEEGRERKILGGSTPTY